MGEIRIVGPGKTRGYPYPVCKNIFSGPLGSLSSVLADARGVANEAHLITGHNVINPSLLFFSFHLTNQMSCTCIIG